MHPRPGNPIDPKHGHARKWTGKIARRHKISDHRPNRDAASGGNGKGNQRTGVWIYTKKTLESPGRQTTGHLHQQPKFKRIYRGRETNICHFRHESEELLKHGGWKGYYLGRCERRDLEGRRDHGSRVNLVLLLHDILTSKLKGDSKTELGRLLERKEDN